MNKIFKVIFNASTQCFTAVSELGKSHNAKSHATSQVPHTRLLTWSVAALLFMAGLSTASFAAPTDGNVVAGVANISQVGNITHINQSSQNAAINWQSFGINANETVNFNQPNAEAITLNRVLGNERSVIDGALKANGKVFIQNPNGTLIGKNAQINVGSLIATTAHIHDSDFMNGDYRFDGTNQGSIENLGQITVPKGGVVALIAPIVKNGGTIHAKEANVLLASADSFTIRLPNSSMDYTLDKGSLQGLVDNGGAILADGGRVVLTAQGLDSVKKSVINHSGIIQANTVSHNNGKIELLGDLDNSRLEVSGTLTAEATGDGDGGFIETSASQVKIADIAHVSTKADNGKTGKWLLDPNDLIIGAGGVMTGTQVSNAVNNNDFELKSTNGKASGKGDIIINDEINWNKNTLTLNAQNDIHINANLNGSGTAKLALVYGQSTADGRVNPYVPHNDHHIKKGVKINLPEGENFSTKKGSAGETKTFTVIHQLPDIVKNAQGEWESKLTDFNVALSGDIDASYTKNYQGFAGWEPSSGKDIHGLGHVVDGLYLRTKKDNQNAGLFTFVRGEVRDIGVTNVDIISKGNSINIGGLAGYAYDIKNSYATGKVEGKGFHVYAGGLAGQMEDTENSYTTSTVAATGGSSSAGGLAGRGGARFSYATGNVSVTGELAHAGGLVGYGSSVSSYATGDVSAAGDRARAGGLLGDSNTNFYNYATGNVSATGRFVRAGGLAGSGSAKESYATGNVSATGEGAYVGGLVGYSDGSDIQHSYANNSSITATGNNSRVGGVVGQVGSGNAKNSFFNQTKLPILQAVGGMDNPASAKTTNITGKSDSELKQKSTFFNDWAWFDYTWRISEGSDYPRLRGLTKGSVNIQADSLNKTYDSTAVSTANDLNALNSRGIITVTGLKDGDTLASLEGQLSYNGTWQDVKDVGTYTVIPTGLGGQKYEITYGEGSLTINPKTVNITSTGTKEHDGKDTVNIKDGTINQQGIYDDDKSKVVIDGSLTLASADVGTQSVKNDNSKITLTGDAAKNYVVGKVDGTWQITQTTPPVTPPTPPVVTPTPPTPTPPTTTPPVVTSTPPVVTPPVVVVPPVVTPPVTTPPVVTPTPPVVTPPVVMPTLPTPPVVASQAMAEVYQEIGRQVGNLRTNTPFQYKKMVELGMNADYPMVIIRDGQMLDIGKNTAALKSGDIISTKEYVSTVIFSDGSWVKLDKHTTIRVDYDVLIDDKADTPKIKSIVLLKGKIIDRGNAQ